MNIDGALAAILHDMGFPPPAGRFLFIVGRVAGLTAEVAEEYAREKPMRIKFTVEYDGAPAEAGVSTHGTDDHRGRNRRRPRAGRPRARRDGARSSTTTRPRSIGCAAPSAWAGGN